MRSKGTHVVDATNLIEIQPPCSNQLFMILCADKLADDRPFTSLDDVCLDRSYGPTVGGLVSTTKSSGVYITGSAHVSNRSIASIVDRLSSSCRLPFIPRSRTWQTSAQASPSWTQSASLIAES